MVNTKQKARKHYFQRLKELREAEGRPGNQLANEIKKANPRLSTKRIDEIIKMIFSESMSEAENFKVGDNIILNDTKFKILEINANGGLRVKNLSNNTTANYTNREVKQFLSEAENFVDLLAEAAKFKVGQIVHTNSGPAKIIDIQSNKLIVEPVDGPKVPVEVNVKDVMTESFKEASYTDVRRIATPVDDSTYALTTRDLAKLFGASKVTVEGNSAIHVKY